MEGSSRGENPAQLTTPMLLMFACEIEHLVFNCSWVWIHGLSIQEGPAPDLTFSCHYLEILIIFKQRSSTFSFFTGSCKLRSLSWFQIGFSWVDSNMILHPRWYPYWQKEETSQKQAGSWHPTCGFPLSDTYMVNGEVTDMQWESVKHLEPEGEVLCVTSEYKGHRDSTCPPV